MIFPYRVYSHYSIQRAFAKIPDLVKKAYDLGLPAIALTDKMSVSSAVEFFQEIEKINKGKDRKIRGVIGSELSVVGGLSQAFEITVLCKNKQGWLDLLKILSQQEDGFVHFESVRALLTNLIIVTDYEGLPQNYFTHKEFASRPVYYVEPADRLYQQIIICSNCKRTLSEKDILISDNPEYAMFFDDTKSWHLSADCANEASLELLRGIEDFSIFCNPKMPQYLDDSRRHVDDPDAFLRELCRKGWVDRGINSKVASTKGLKDIYVARIKEELETFHEANLANYILCIWDFVNYTRSHNQSCGLRGSAVGCLVSYLIGISDVDPIWPDDTIPYDPARSLLFGRFYNRWRNVDGHIALPDIDFDVPIDFREKLIAFVKEKYGVDKTAHIITFLRMDGKAAIKEVFRVTGNSFDVANEITKHMVDTAKIQDELEDLRQDHPDYGVINYCIDEIPKIAEMYQEYKEQFDIAIKLASTIRSTGKHAAGIVISDQPLASFLPIIKDPESGEAIVAFEYVDAEQVGAVKYDFLGVAAYSKMDSIRNMIENNLTECLV